MNKRLTAAHCERAIEALDALEAAFLVKPDGLSMLRVGEIMQSMHAGACDKYLAAHDPEAPKLSQLDLMQFLIGNRLLASYLKLREKYDTPDPAAFLRAIFEDSRKALRDQWAANDSKQAVAG